MKYIQASKDAYDTLQEAYQIRSLVIREKISPEAGLKALDGLGIAYYTLSSEPRAISFQSPSGVYTIGGVDYVMPLLPLKLFDDKPSERNAE